MGWAGCTTESLLPPNEDYYKSIVWGMNMPLGKQEEEVSLVMVLAVSRYHSPLGPGWPEPVSNRLSPGTVIGWDRHMT